MPNFLNHFSRAETEVKSLFKRGYLKENSTTFERDSSVKAFLHG